MKLYKPSLTATVNTKGVLDVDTVKGCAMGMAATAGGCYGECYAAKTARRYGINFAVSVSRLLTPKNMNTILNKVSRHSLDWYRIGVAGDPSHDWDNTVKVCQFLAQTNKVPVIVTKHWNVASEAQLRRLKCTGAVFNTSTSGMDTDEQAHDRIEQIERIRAFGIKSVCRIVTCDYGKGAWASRCRSLQDYLLGLKPIIDTPFRASNNNTRVKRGEIILTKCDKSVGGGSRYVSLNDKSAFLGKCEDCPDQCGLTI